MACTGFAGATELLEQLVAHTGIEFRRLKRAIEHAVALSLQQGEADMVSHEALEQALQVEGLAVTVDADTVRRLQDPTTILAAKQVVGGPGPQILQAEIAQLDTFVVTQRQAWEKRAEHLRVQYAACQGG
jgi:hypothetical protein